MLPARLLWHRPRPKRLIPALVLAALVGASLSPTALAEEGEFPLRSTYADVSWISIDDLARTIDEHLIVDVRSEFEYDIIHIAGAAHDAIARSTFAADLREITEGDVKASLVFYCNGHTCAKSYKAVRKAHALGYENAVAFDAGIFEWARKHPEYAVLLGKSPADPSDLIPAEELARHSLPAERFIEAAQGGESVLIDARDPMQQQQTPDFGRKRIANYYLAKLPRLLESPGFRARSADKTLYIFDATGEQVRWIQYHLEKLGYRDYYFLQGGVWSVFGEAGATDVSPASPGTPGD